MADLNPKCPHCGNRNPFDFLRGPYCHGPDELSYFNLHQWKKCKACGTGWRTWLWVEADDFNGLEDFVVQRWDDFPVEREYYYDEIYQYIRLKTFRCKFEEDDEKTRKEKQQQKLEELKKTEKEIFRKKELCFRDLFGNKIDNIYNYNGFMICEE